MFVLFVLSPSDALRLGAGCDELCVIYCLYHPLVGPIVRLEELILSGTRQRRRPADVRFFSITRKPDTPGQGQIQAPRLNNFFGVVEGEVHVQTCLGTYVCDSLALIKY